MISAMSKIKQGKGLESECGVVWESIHDYTRQWSGKDS